MLAAFKRNPEARPGRGRLGLCSTLGFPSTLNQGRMRVLATFKRNPEARPGRGCVMLNRQCTPHFGSTMQSGGCTWMMDSKWSYGIYSGLYRVCFQVACRRIGLLCHIGFNVALMDSHLRIQEKLLHTRAVDELIEFICMLM